MEARNLGIFWTVLSKWLELILMLEGVLLASWEAMIQLFHLDLSQNPRSLLKVGLERLVNAAAKHVDAAVDACSFNLSVAFRTLSRNLE